MRAARLDVHGLSEEGRADSGPGKLVGIDGLGPRVFRFPSRFSLCPARSLRVGSVAIPDSGNGNTCAPARLELGQRGEPASLQWVSSV